MGAALFWGGFHTVYNPKRAQIWYNFFFYKSSSELSSWFRILLSGHRQH